MSASHRTARKHGFAPRGSSCPSCPHPCGHSHAPAPPAPAPQKPSGKAHLLHQAVLTLPGCPGLSVPIAVPSVGDTVPVMAEQGGPSKGVKLPSIPMLSAPGSTALPSLPLHGEGRLQFPLGKAPLNSFAAFASFPRVCSQFRPSVPYRRREHPRQHRLCTETVRIKQGCCHLARVTLGGLSGPGRSGEQPGNLFNASGGVCRNPIAGEEKSPVLAGARHWRPRGLTGFSPGFATGLGWEEELF